MVVEVVVVNGEYYRVRKYEYVEGVVVELGVKKERYRKYGEAVVVEVGEVKYRVRKYDVYDVEGYVTLIELYSGPTEDPVLPTDT